MGSHVGPIIFSHPVAREQLVDHGVVTTFRTGTRTTGETWWTDGRGNAKRGDVTVRLCRSLEPTPRSLLEYQPESGFATCRDWLQAIREINGATQHGRIYRVTTRGGA